LGEGRIGAIVIANQPEKLTMLRKIQGEIIRMTPIDYENMVAEYFRSQGYSVKTTQQSSDWGVDAIAEKGAEKIALQMKMYGDSPRKINRKMIMELHGAKDYFSCTKAIIISDGSLEQSASQVADKLGILFLPLSKESLAYKDQNLVNNDLKKSEENIAQLTFDHIWETYIQPLAGRNLIRPNGKNNTILEVDWSGLKRTTSSGRTQFIQIDIFKFAVRMILERGYVHRDEINEMHVDRASSGIILILEQVPMFAPTSRPSGLKLISSNLI
jgi:hypothetical protein